MKYVLSILLMTFCGVASGYVDQRFLLPMSDGVRLDTRVIRPDGAGPFPVVLYRTPYGELGAPGIAMYAAQGYATVAQNCRGRLNSEGENKPFYADGWAGPTDGLDTVNWILAQPWCNGKICMTGGSARGITQNLVAGANPDGMKAQFIVKAAKSMYKLVYYGGVFRPELMLPWLSENDYDPSSPADFEAHPYYDDFWKIFDLEDGNRQQYRDYAVVNVAGWYDCMLQETIDNFMGIRASGQDFAKEHAKLIITLSSHAGQGSGAFPFPQTAMEEPEPYANSKFFARYVQDEDNGYDRLPRVAYYMMGDMKNAGAPGNEWRYADDWPIPSTDASFYLHPDHTLQLRASESDGQFTYTYDPAHPAPTYGGANLSSESGNHDQRVVESRNDVVLFDFGPLAAPVEVAGRIKTFLYASSDALDTDFTAKLTDVYPSGESVLLCDGIIRARCRSSFITPELLTPGTVYEFEIDLSSTANVFNTGHRIRLAVSSSNYPRFSANPNTGAQFDIDDPVKQAANNTIYVGESHPSRLVLPISGPDTDSDTHYDLLDAFPQRPDEWSDADGDGLGDLFEERIVEANPADGIISIELVEPEDDFDGDGSSNLAEFVAGTNPADGISLPVWGVWQLPVALILLVGSHFLAVRKRSKTS